MVHVRAKSITNKLNLLNSVNKIVKKVKNSSPNTKVVFSSVAVHKDEKHVVKKFAESCSNYFYQKTLILLITETLLKIRSEIVIIIEDFMNLKVCLNMKHVTRPQKTSMQESNSDKDYRKCSNHKLLLLNVFPKQICRKYNQLI